jgi:hypothetical protein
VIDISNPLHHAMSAAKQWGGSWEDYIAIEDWFDAPKGWMPDFRSRAIRHHSEGIAEAVKLFDPIKLSSGRLVPIRFVAERHIVEDLGRIPTAADWLRCIKPEQWMVARARKLSKELEDVA